MTQKAFQRMDFIFCFAIFYFHDEYINISTKLRYCQLSNTTTTTGPDRSFSLDPSHATLDAMPKLRRMKTLPLSERPREKMQKLGASGLSDFELIEGLVGTGAAGITVGQVSRSILRLLHKHGGSITYEQLVDTKGVGEATAIKVLSALEITRRYVVRDALPLQSQQDFLARLSDMRTLQQENFVCLSLDGGQRLIARRTITIGLLDSVQAHPREVFADAIADRAASIVIAHNHPSGDPQPSQRDITCTQQLAAAGQLLGIALRDHLILTKTEHFSFAQHHLF